MTPVDQALHDYYFTDNHKKLVLHNSYGNPEEMPIEVFFRGEGDLSDVEMIALDFADGAILDMGAGTGVHSKILQERGEDVTAIELSAKACEIMQLTGVENIVNDSFYNHSNSKYDTLLLLMNGFGLAGNLNKIPEFLEMLKGLLNENGKVLVDSSDLSYMKEELSKDHYFGEIKFCYEYKHIVGEWFNWLYIDQAKLTTILVENGWSCDIMYADENDQYLAIIQPI